MLKKLSCRAGWWKISEGAAAVTGVRATAGETSVCGRGGGWIEREESRQKGSERQREEIGIETAARRVGKGGNRIQGNDE